MQSNSMRPSEASTALGLAFSARLPVMMWGSPGIGKSAVVKQRAKAEGREVYDIRLALLDPTDLRGIPFYNPEKQTAEWAVASMLPQDPDSKVIIFLDEINAAPPSVQAAAYQLVLDRAIGEYRLPEGVDIVAAGNREGDKAVTFKMPTPLLNRFIHIDFDVHFDDWHEWAIKNRIHEHVVAFLNHKKNLLNKFDAKSMSRGFPTPRSWEFVSRLLYANSEGGSTILKSMIAGAVGEGAAVEFWGFREISMKLPLPLDVLKGKVKEMPDRDNLSAAYSMIISLNYELQSQHEKLGKSKEWLEMGATYFEFIHDNFNPEYCVMGVRDALKNMKLPLVQVPNWKKFAKDYSKLVMAA